MCALGKELRTGIIPSMTDDFLGTLLTNNPRAKIVRVFMFNPVETFTVPTLAKRAGVSTKNVEKELKALEAMKIVKKGKLSIHLAGSLKRVAAKKQKVISWTLNAEFKHATALAKFVHEVSPVQYKSIVGALRRSGRVSAIILSGSFMGDPTRPADLIIATDTLNEARLEQAIRALEPDLGREIRYAAFTTPEFRYRLTVQDRLMRDTLDYPHLVLLDRTRLL